MQELKDVLTQSLRAAGHRATPQRLALLRVLREAGAPLPAADIAAQLSQEADQATVYRTLDALTLSGLVRKVVFNDRHAYYESAIGEEHHHHIVCRDCGKVEDVATCTADDLMRRALANSKSFSNIQAHSLEFFSTCNSCVNRA